VDINAQLQKLKAAISKHGCPTCRGCGSQRKSGEFIKCHGCNGTGEGKDWAERITNGG
jgi:ribosomal protein L37AE/L43A